MVVDAPPTGFKSTLNLRKSTRFATEEEAKAFMKDRGIFRGMAVQVGSGNPLTPPAARTIRTFATKEEADAFRAQAGGISVRYNNGSSCGNPWTVEVDSFPK